MYKTRVYPSCVRWPHLNNDKNRRARRRQYLRPVSRYIADGRGTRLRCGRRRGGGRRVCLVRSIFTAATADLQCMFDGIFIAFKWVGPDPYNTTLRLSYLYRIFFFFFGQRLVFYTRFSIFNY